MNRYKIRRMKRSRQRNRYKRWSRESIRLLPLYEEPDDPYDISGRW